MKKILIIAGPNGAGKTTFAWEFLPNEAGCPAFVNADLIAAGRLMLGRIRDLVRAGKSFALETTLSTRSYLRLIPRWQSAGYRVKLCFLRLPDADFAIRRVAQRVRFGGHDIPKATIRRRFERGWENLLSGDLEIVDESAIYDASHAPVMLMQTGERFPPDKLIEDPTPYRTTNALPAPVRPLDDPDFMGAEAAFQRASAKAIARALDFGLEPVVSNPQDLPKLP